MSNQADKQEEQLLSPMTPVIKQSLLYKSQPTYSIGEQDSVKLKQVQSGDAALLFKNVSQLSVESIPQDGESPQKVRSEVKQHSEQDEDLFDTSGPMNNIISQILDNPRQHPKIDSEFVRVKNDILIILLLLSSYGIYYVVGEFVDVILIAVIAGVSYQQIRDNFVDKYLSQASYRISDSPISFKKRMSYGFMATLGILALPWIRKVLGDPNQLRNMDSIGQIFTYGLLQNHNKTIYNMQLMLGAFAFSLVIGMTNIMFFLKYIRPRGTYAVSIARSLFALGTVIIIVTSLVIIPLVLYRELITTGIMIENKIEENFNCTLVSLDVQSTLPFCTQKISGSEALKQAIRQLRDQNETIRDCVKTISSVQTQYLDRKIFNYEEDLCTWISIGQKANNYFDQNAKGLMFSTSANIFKTVFGNLASFLQHLSMVVFNATTFITVFYLTVTYFQPSRNVFSEILTGQRKKLFGEITTLIQATFYIVLQHFVMSFILLEVFSFSSVNLLLSLLLSSMAFIPLFRPWFGILILTSLSVLIGNLRMLFSIGDFITTLDLYSALLLVIIYYYLSETIYSINLVKMEVHEIITNMTVLFGIYQFGVSGIFYGPLILILFRCVHRELLKSNASRISMKKALIH